MISRWLYWHSVRTVCRTISQVKLKERYRLRLEEETEKGIVTFKTLNIIRKEYQNGQT